MSDATPDAAQADRIAAICERFEQDFVADRKPTIERCLGESRDPFRAMLLKELLAAEVKLRQRKGETPQREDYLSRFPAHPSVIQQVFVDATAALSSVKITTAETAESPTLGFSYITIESQPLESLGRFQIQSILGEGAFGTVYRAHDPQLDRDVAIKVPRAGFLQSDADRERFLREARAAAGLQHAQICQVYEVGTIDQHDYIVMAFIDGKPLSKVVQTQSKLTDKQIVSVIRKIAQGLAEAHNHGVIHRDLKPANIMINRRGEPVIMDFGLARRSNSDDAQISQSGQIMGTPAYMSPEQARGGGKLVGHATDIYSLGVIFYELLCGRRPYEGTVTEVIGQILHVAPDPPSKHRPDLDQRLEKICLRAIARNTEDRFQSMTEFAVALAEILRSGTTVQPKATATLKRRMDDPEPPTDDFAKIMAAMSFDLEEKVERAATRAVRKTRKQQKNQVQMPWWIYLAGSGFMSIVVLYAMFFIGRKDTVTVVVNIPLEFKNDASLMFTLDDRPIAREAFDGPLELKPGDHELLLTRDNKLLKKFRFRVGTARNQKVEVEDITPAAPPEPSVATTAKDDWVELFNGRDLENWRSANGQPAAWKVENGYIETVPGSGPIMTSQTFPLDFELQAEFWLPSEPHKSDQTRTNSGIYLLGRHEVQICDSYQNPIKNAKTGCGALYAEIAPSSNPATGPETWQTFRITYHSPRVNDARQLTRPGRLSVIYNGQPVIDDAMVYSLNSGEPQNQDYGQPGPILLQDRKSKIRFRHVRLRPLQDGDQAVFMPLIPGDDLRDWQGQPGVWSMKNGVLTGQPHRAGQTFLYHPRLQADFELKFQVRIAETDNTGVQIRSQMGDRTTYTVRGPQADIGSQADAGWGSLFGEQLGGWVVKPDAIAVVKPGEWNDYFIRCSGKRVSIQVNGKTTIDGAVVDLPASGILAFQVHPANQHPVEFRQLTIRVLKPVTIPADTSPAGGHSYKFYPEKLPWDEARSRCEALGGHLVIIDNLEENAFCGKLIETAGWEDAWIGISDEDQEGLWKTVYGDAPTYLNWGPQQPNNKQPGEHWALMTNIKVADTPLGWTWADQPKDTDQHKPGFVCEWDTAP